MERIALAIWRNRISPLFDVARRIMVVDIENGEVCGAQEDVVFSDSLAGKVSRLGDLNIDTLICGAISKELAHLLTSGGIEVIAFIAGDKDAVLTAYMEQKQVPSAYIMPGCGGRGIQRRRRARVTTPPMHRLKRGAGGYGQTGAGKNGPRYTPGR